MQKTLAKIALSMLIASPIISFATQTFSLHSSSRDAMGNLVCTYANGETINMGQSWSSCPSSISR
jgi:hypothetical protein